MLDCYLRRLFIVESGEFTGIGLRGAFDVFEGWLITEIGCWRRFLIFESCGFTEIGNGDAILFFIGVGVWKKISAMRFYFLMKFDKSDKNKSRWRFEIDFWIFEK